MRTNKIPSAWDEQHGVDISCELVIRPALFIMEARLPMGLVKIVNEYIDSVRETAADHSKLLVGQIRQNSKSAQLQDGAVIAEALPMAVV